MHILLTNDEIHQVLTTNIQDWKKYADIGEAQDLNKDLTPDALITICSADFFDDINDESMSVCEILDKHFLNIDDSYSRESFIVLHNIYNR